MSLEVAPMAKSVWSEVWPFSYDENFTVGNGSHIIPMSRQRMAGDWGGDEAETARQLSVDYLSLVC